MTCTNRCPSRAVQQQLEPTAAGIERAAVSWRRWQSDTGLSLMSRFTDVLLVSPLADGKTWVVMRPFGYQVGAETSGDSVEVAVGFQTDFASIPRLLWVVLPKWGTYGNATVIHDWLYWEQARPRVSADAIFFEAMGVLGVRSTLKYPMYWAVRSFGWLAWYRNQADRDAGFSRVLQDRHVKATAQSQRPGLVVQLGSHAWRSVTRSGGRG